MTIVLLSLAMALFLTTVLLPLCGRYAAPLGLLDEAGEKRKIHTVSIPRSGGLAIVSGAVAAAIWWLPKDSQYIPLLAATLLVAVFGYLDDRFTLASWQKALGQLLATFIFLYCYGGLPDLPFMPLDAAPLWLTGLWSLGFMVGVTNAINLADGLDGLAAGNSLLSMLLLAFLGFEIGRLDYTLMALATAGGLLGFLRFNTHPARLFMGDAGSQFLGFTGAALTILILASGLEPYSALLPVLVFGLPILDTLSVMVVRKWRGRPVFQADRSHLHHQLLALGLRHYEVVAILYGLQALIVVLAYHLRYAPDAVLLLTYGSYCAVVLGVIFVARSAGWRAHAGSASPVERRNRWLRRFDWYHRHTAKVLAFALALIFLAVAATRLLFDSRGAVVADGMAAAAPVTGIVLGAAALWFRKHPEFVARLVSFVATAFCIHGIVFGLQQHPLLQTAVDTSLVMLALLLIAAIRLTRRSQFHLDTQDFLMLFIVAVGPLLLLDEVDGQLLGQIAIRVIVLLYACEFVVTKGGGSRWVLSSAGIVSLLLQGPRLEGLP